MLSNIPTRIHCQRKYAVRQQAGAAGWTSPSHSRKTLSLKGQRRYRRYGELLRTEGGDGDGPIGADVGAAGQCDRGGGRQRQRQARWKEGGTDVTDTFEWMGTLDRKKVLKSGVMGPRHHALSGRKTSSEQPYLISGNRYQCETPRKRNSVGVAPVFLPSEGTRPGLSRGPPWRAR
jgi:hypothetical protein